jgi:hypothetical protein
MKRLKVNSGGAVSTGPKNLNLYEFDPASIRIGPGKDGKGLEFYGKCNDADAKLMGNYAPFKVVFSSVTGLGFRGEDATDHWGNHYTVTGKFGDIHETIQGTCANWRERQEKMEAVFEACYKALQDYVVENQTKFAKYLEGQHTSTMKAWKLNHKGKKPTDEEQDAFQKQLDIALRVNLHCPFQTRDDGTFQFKLGTKVFFKGKDGKASKPPAFVLAGAAGNPSAPKTRDYQVIESAYSQNPPLVFSQLKWRIANPDATEVIDPDDIHYELVSPNDSAHAFGKIGIWETGSKMGISLYTYHGQTLVRVGGRADDEMDNTNDYIPAGFVNTVSGGGPVPVADDNNDDEDADGLDEDQQAILKVIDERADADGCVADAQMGIFLGGAVSPQATLDALATLRDKGVLIKSDSGMHHLRAPAKAADADADADE